MRTMLSIWVAVFSCVALGAAGASPTGRQEVNNRPIIGVLAMATISTNFPNCNKTHIGASYVKYLESSGARVVPIKINQPISYYRKMTKNLNGIFFPGSVAEPELQEQMFNSELLQKVGYVRAAALLFNFALLENKKGNYLPMWGTCLGFQTLVVLSAEKKLPDSLKLRERCNANNMMVPLEFSQDFRDSRLFKNIPDYIVKTLKEQNVTAHYHNYCVTEETMEKFGIRKWWRVLSTNHDFDGFKFVSTLESINYPIYASIYHTEKSPFEWDVADKTPHNIDAIQESQYFGNFFVNEARKNNNKFDSKEEEEAALIYNYPVTYTNSYYRQTYFLD